METGSFEPSNQSAATAQLVDLSGDFVDGDERLVQYNSVSSYRYVTFNIQVNVFEMYQVFKLMCHYHSLIRAFC